MFIYKKELATNEITNMENFGYPWIFIPTKKKWSHSIQLYLAQVAQYHIESALLPTCTYQGI